MKVKRKGYYLLLLGLRKHLWTERLRIYFPFQLNVENATLAALLCHVLMRGSRNHPDIVSLERAMERLYGMSIDMGITKLGDVLVLKVTLKAPKSEYIPSSRRFTRNVLKLFAEVLFQPVEGRKEFFNEEYLRQEKRILTAQLSALKNNRTLYSHLLFLEKFCPEEPYRLYEYGAPEYVASATDEQLHSFYRRMLRRTPFILYTDGFDHEEVLDMLDGLGEKADELSVMAQKIRRARKKVVRSREYMDVKQAQLWMGFRAAISASDERAVVAQLLSSAFGGTPVSRLFKNVRERRSLVYDIHSYYVQSKSLLIVYAAVAPENARKVEALVLNEWEKILSGELSEDEISTAKKYAIQTLRSLEDAPLALADYYAYSAFLGMNETVNRRINGIRRVRLDDIFSVAEEFRLDTVFTLLPEE